MKEVVGTRKESIQKTRDKVGSYLFLVLSGLVCLLVVQALFTTSIPSNSVGIVYSFGAVEGSWSPGLHFKMPWQGVTFYSTGIQSFDVSPACLSEDKFQSGVKLSVSYRATESSALEIVKKYGFPTYSQYPNGVSAYVNRFELLQSEKIERILCNDLSLNTAESIYFYQRNLIEDAIESKLFPVMREEGVELISVSVLRIDIPDEIENKYQNELKEKTSAEQLNLSRVKELDEMNYQVKKEKVQTELIKIETENQVLKKQGEAKIISEYLNGLPEDYRKKYIESLENAELSSFPDKIFNFTWQVTDRNLTQQTGTNSVSLSSKTTEIIQACGSTKVPKQQFLDCLNSVVYGVPSKTKSVIYDCRANLNGGEEELKACIYIECQKQEINWC